MMVLMLPFAASAQQIPPPTGPVTFCGSQAPPPADTFTYIFDGGTPQPLTMDATKHAGCAASDTHSFQLPGNLFTLGSHTVRVQGRNAFGTTNGPTYTVQVGIAPGQFTITGVIPPPGE